jgi:hypothetical protein
MSRTFEEVELNKARLLQCLEISHTQKIRQLLSKEVEPAAASNIKIKA